MTWIKAFGIGVARVVTGNPNTVVFAVGLALLCLSVAQWSGPLAGAIAGAVLMTVGVWPFIARRARGSNE
jgi:hypothetical protein